jgi:poly-gamma-glutamate synthesis protein (capsule biosynthesis protein)
MARLPTIREACNFSLCEALAYDGLCAVIELARGWRYPVRASGDLEEMRFRDKLYWLYKTSRPIVQPSRGSRLDEYFARSVAPSLPAGFVADREATLTAVGDLMPHPYLAASRDSLYADVKDLIFDADLAMANLESVVLDAPPKLEVDFKAGPPVAMDRAAFAVAAGGYDFLATACNHSLDFGEAGVASTIAAVRAGGIAFHGVNEHEADADRATVIERNGIRFGIVAHTFGTNAHRAPPSRPRIVNHTKLNRTRAEIDFSLLEAQLRSCVNVDFIVVQLHWGMEFEMYPRPEQLEVAHHIAELGADAIIGHHPHVLQPVEYYRTRRDRDRVVPIYYSLGNLTNPFAHPYMWCSGIARLVVAKDAHRTYVRSAELVEVDQVVDGETIRLRARARSR